MNGQETVLERLRNRMQPIVTYFDLMKLRESGDIGPEELGRLDRHIEGVCFKAIEEAMPAVLEMLRDDTLAWPDGPAPDRYQAQPPPEQPKGKETVMLKSARVWLQKGRYPNNRISLRAISAFDEMVLLSLSVNLPDEDIEPDEVAIKDWSENAGYLKALIDCGAAHPPHRSIGVGNGNRAQVVRLTGMHLNQ